MNQINRFNPPNLFIEEDKPCCDNPDIIISDDGFRVCKNCGIIKEQELVSYERRAFTPDEIRKRRRTEPRWRSFGPRTVILRVKSDARGQQLTAKRQVLFARLSKIQGSLINSLERNYWEAKPKLHALAARFPIPDYIVETAWKIYSEVARQKLTMGRSIDAFVCASLYASVRIHCFPRLLEELCDMSLVPFRFVHRSLTLILQHVFPILNLKYKPVELEPLVYRFGNDLQLSISMQKGAANLLTTASKNGLFSMGKDPKGLAAAAIYLTIRNTNERRTQAKIAEVSRVTEVTLRTRAKQIKSCLDQHNL